MQKLSLVAAVLCTTVVAVAQNCNGAPAPRVFSNRPDFGSSFYYNIGNHFFDLTAQTAIAINSMRTWTYDSGTGNPPTPNQVGATGVVNVYTCPTTRSGNESISPTTTGTPWTLLGSGTITIVATPGESQTVFTPPLQLAAGTYGVAVEYLPTTTGPASGPLHCLGLSPNPGLPAADAFLTMSNDGIQGVSWSGGATASPNLRIDYTPAANSAQYVAFGDGCYFRPLAFYQDFPPSATTPSLANTGIQMLPLGPNYLCIGVPSSIAPTSSPSLTLTPPAASSSANWDDALSAPLTLPFTFNYPGGSTTTITISSNGSVFLDAVSSTAYSVCGASYGTILPFRDGAPRIAPFYHDLDPSAAGGLYYDVDPANQFVRITWDQVPEWPVPTAINTIQLTLNASGQVDISYGSLANTGVANGNNAIAGFTPGFGSRLPPSMNIVASLPFQSGDGSLPPILSMDARPVLGTSPNVVTSNITPGTLGQLLLAGVLGTPTPVDLTPFGMPGCSQHIVPFTTLFNVLGPGGTFTQAFPIPNNAAFQNVQFFFQAAPLTAGLNAAGLVTSNGLCAKIGQ